MGERALEIRATGWLALRVGLAFVVLSSAVGAEPSGEVTIDLMVSEIGSQPGKIDPRAEKLHARIKDELSYQSLKVVDARQLKLEIDEVGKLTLPNGHTLMVKPILVDERGALLAVELEPELKTDLRVRDGQLVVLGPQHHGSTKLVVSLEPHL